MQVLDRIRGAAMLDRPAENAKSTIRTFFAHGPIKAVVEGSDLVWNTNMNRVDNVAGTKLSQGGPL